MPAPEPDDLHALGNRLDKVRRESKAPETDGTPTSLGIAMRFGTEFGAALAVGGGLGWLIDRWFHTAPVFIVVMFCLGAAAGIRNVMHAAAELNAQIAAHPAAAAKDKDDEE